MTVREENVKKWMKFMVKKGLGAASVQGVTTIRILKGTCSFLKGVVSYYVCLMIRLVIWGVLLNLSSTLSAQVY